MEEQPSSGAATSTKSELIELLEASWLPIDTAPKDGTEIIVSYNFATVWIVHNAFWREVDEDLLSLGWTLEETGWWTYPRNSTTQEMLEGPNTPTHWIPMPPLPV